MRIYRDQGVYCGLADWRSSVPCAFNRYRIRSVAHEGWVPFRQDEPFDSDRSSIGIRLSAMFHTAESQVTCYD